MKHYRKQDILEKKIEAILNHLCLTMVECNICTGTGRTSLDYWDKEGGSCIECGGNGFILQEVY